MNTAKGFLNIINHHYNHLPANEVIIAYDGDITHQLMKAFVSMVEEKLEDEGEDESVQRKLYHTLVECLQNINRHAEYLFQETGKKYPGRGAVLLVKKVDHYNLVTVNIILKEQVKNLRNFLENLNSLSQDELNDFYKKQLMEGSMSSKGGAGLGFIDICRKTANKIEFDFIDNNEKTSYFINKIIITRK